MSYTNILNELEELVARKNLSQKELSVVIGGFHTSAVLSAAKEANLKIDSIDDHAVSKLMDTIEKPGIESDSFINTEVQKLFPSGTNEMFQQVFEEKFEKLLTDFSEKVKAL